METEIFQESPKLKAEWVERMKRDFPVGCRVRVVASDKKSYLGATGTVCDYDVGGNGDYPMIGTAFDPALPGEPARDGFYDDEIVRVSE